MGAQQGSPRFGRFGLDEGLTQPSALALVQDSTGFIWVGTQNGLNRFDGTSFRQFVPDPTDSSALADGYIRSLLVDGAGTLWVGTRSGGVHRYDARSESFQGFDLGRDWPSPRADSNDRRVNDVQAIAEGSDGVLWLATAAGLVRFERESGRARPAVIDGGREGELSGPVRAVVAVEGEDLWVGYDDGTLMIARPRGEVLVHIATARVAGAVLTILPISADSILVGSAEGGLYRFDDRARQVEVIPLPLRHEPFPSPDYVRSIVKDAKGELWLGTRAGLVRLARGGPVLRHQPVPGDPTSLPHAEVAAIVEDRSGVLWVGTWGGLASLSPHRSAIERYTNQGIQAALTGNGVVAIAESHDGVLWLGMMGGDLNRLDRSTGSVEVFPQGPSTDVYSLDLDGAGYLWMALLGGGVVRFDPETRRTRRFPFEPTEAQGQTADVVAIHVDPRGAVWAGTVDGGIYRLDRGSDVFRSYRGPDGSWTPGEPYVWPFADDVESNLWFGTNGPAGGVHRLAPDGARLDSYLADPASRDGLRDGRVLTIHPAGDSSVWIGTQGGGLHRLTPGTGTVRVFRVSDGLPHDNVQAILEDSRGYLWVSTSAGLARLDPSGQDFWVFREAAGLQDDRFFANSAIVGRNGDLLFGGPGGLTVIHPERLARPTTPSATVITGIRISDREAPIERVHSERLTLAPDENSFALEFALLDFTDPVLNRYRYRLEDLDRDWIDNGPVNVALFRSLPPGRYTFRLAVRGSAGLWDEDALTLPVVLRPPYYATWWFRLLLLATLGSAVGAAYTYRMRERLRLQELRLGIAGKLHDDIGANLSTIALKSELAGRATGLDDASRGRLAEVGRLARATTEAVRETVWIVNTDHDTLERLARKMEDTADLLLAGRMEHTFDLAALPDMRIGWELRQDVYFLFKEALNNAVKHSGGLVVRIELSYAAPELRLVVEDDGHGFATEARGVGNGLGLMRRRASRHGGAVEIESRPGGGARIEARFRVR